MLSFFKGKNSQNAKPSDVAYNLYIKAVDQARQLELYTTYQVPDTIDGRFDSLTLHVSILMDRLEQCANETQAAKIGQALFDMLFKNMDQALRENGVGDMGVPKHMRRMLEGFNGRHTRYRTLLSEYYAPSCDEEQRNIVEQKFIYALEKNIFDTQTDSQQAAPQDLLTDKARKLWQYVDSQVSHLRQMDEDDVINGCVSFADFDKIMDANKGFVGQNDKILNKVKTA